MEKDSEFWALVYLEHIRRGTQHEQAVRFANSAVESRRGLSPQV